MEKKDKIKRAINLLEEGLSAIRNFGDFFVAYNTKYLGHRFSDEFIINGKSTKNSKPLNEFCYGYDGEHKQLHLLRVYEMQNGAKYAAIEISMSVYAFWDILN